jgi:aminomethyltransferase
VAATRGAFIDMGKEFIGRDAVRRDLDAGVARHLVGLQLDSKRAARAHDAVRRDGRAVGAVTSGSLAPSLGVAVALAYVERDLARPGQALEVDIRGTPAPARVVELPFYKNGTARRKG